MNFFAYIINKKGEKELVTANLDGTILPGVTRQSIIELARSWGIKVTERKFSVHELIECYEEKRIIESFCSGTAAVVVPIRKITYKNKELSVLGDSKDIGDLTKKIHDTIQDIQYGNIVHEYQHLI